MDELLVDLNVQEKTSSIIKIIGVGGGGGKAVEHMYRQGIKDVDFIICNTEKQDLDNSDIPIKIQLGKMLTEGLGAGNNPERGEQAAIENLDDVLAILEDNTKMVFITAGMGGGTGTGAAPVIAKVAKEMGILTVAIVTMPFSYDGPKRTKQALEGIEKLRENVDSLLVISNEKLSEIYSDFTMTDAFAKADDVLTVAAKGIAEIITLHGYINVDFEDVKTVMTDSGVAVMGSAVAEGEERAITATRNAINSPLLMNSELNEASKILLNITYGEEEMTLDEMDAVTLYVSDTIGNSDTLIWGLGQDKSLGGKVSVTVIATDFKQNKVTEQTSRKNIEKGETIILDTISDKPEKEVKLTGLSDEELDELDRIPAYKRKEIKLSHRFN